MTTAPLRVYQFLSLKAIFHLNALLRFLSVAFLFSKYMHQLFKFPASKYTNSCLSFLHFEIEQFVINTFSYGYFIAPPFCASES